MAGPVWLLYLYPLDGGGLGGGDPRSNVVARGMLAP
jgi:hypothetical protein